MAFSLQAYARVATKLGIVVALGLVYGAAAATKQQVSLVTQSGKKYNVSTQYADKFKGFVSELEGTGYRIDDIGGYNYRNIAGTNVLSMHACGYAVDINQTGRNRVTRPFPKDVTAMASRWGLTHGAVWRNPDTGHFEVTGAKCRG